MHLRHIRPGSLEWQDAQTDERDQPIDRLTPEEKSRLRMLSESGQQASQEQSASASAH